MIMITVSAGFETRDLLLNREKGCPWELTV